MVDGDAVDAEDGADLRRDGLSRRLVMVRVGDRVVGVVVVRVGVRVRVRRSYAASLG